MVNNYQRDGAMRLDGNGGSSPNYFPNSFDDIQVDQSYKESAQILDSNIADWYDRNRENDNDHYSQPRTLFEKVMTKEERQNTINNILGSMKGISGPKKDQIINRQLCHFFRTSISLGMAIASGLGINTEQLEAAMAHPAK
jgi:catalase